MQFRKNLNQKTKRGTMSRGYRSAIFPALLLLCALLAGCGGGGSHTATLSAAGNTLANGTEGVAYSAGLTATGGTAPYTWVIQGSGPALPTGLTLSSAGMITGTPTKAGAYGPYVFAVTDKNGLTASTSGLNLTIAAAGPTVTTTALADGSVGVAYSMTLAATGGNGPSPWSVTTGGALPAGLTLAGNGNISGTPAAARPF